MKSAPPGGSSRTVTSSVGRRISASSAQLSSIGASSASPAFIDQIVTTGWRERRISSEGCSVTLQRTDRVRRDRAEIGGVERRGVGGVIGAGARGFEARDIGEIGQVPPPARRWR